MTEQDWDKKLNIDTVGRDASVEDAYHFPYEPTPYSVLERLTKCGYMNQDNIVVDYGCGKGRVGLFLNFALGSKTVGIEFNEIFWSKAVDNRRSYYQRKHAGTQNGVEFKCISAETYVIEDADRFYFFNPFSVEILKSVIGKIKKAYYNNPREMYLFFYYPSDEYISFLMTVPELCFVDEVDCGDLFEGENDRERIVIFEMI